MPTSGMTGYNDAINIETAELSIADDPFEGAAAIFDSRGSERDRSHAVFDIENVPSAFELEGIIICTP